MYPINTIARSAEKDRKLNILLFNDSCIDYVKSFYCLKDVNFYLFENRFKSSRWIRGIPLPENVSIIRGHEDIKNIDAIITFNRGISYEEATALANHLHLPNIVIDFASSEILVPFPFFATSNATDREELFKRSGDIRIGINEHITKSWSTPYHNASITIKPLPIDIEFGTSPKNKVLIPKSIPEDFIKQLPQNLLGGIEITKNIQEAGVYLNLWQNLDEDTLCCMKNNIPVVSFQTNEIPKDCYFLVNPDNVNTTLRQFLSEQFSEEQLSVINNTKKIAKEYVSTSEEEFKSSWNSVFNFVKKTPYIRR